MTRVFIDGSAGTTGLRIGERLASRADIELISLPGELRKDRAAREEAINSADVAFFCLPDEAAIEAAALVHGPTVVIDTSTAHRTAEGWAYGFPELQGKRERIAASKRIANPGCHASGFISLVEPLVRAGLIDGATPLSCFSVTGYSGGGKKMIGEYEAEGRSPLLDSPRQYALGQQHKHLKEMTKLCSLEVPPIFCPIVADYYSGMQVTVPLHKKQIRGTAEDIAELYAEYYGSGLVHFDPLAEGAGLLAANALTGRDDMSVTVAGNGERILLISTFDNLGKGASGAAIQNMNLVLGMDETMSLAL